MVLYENVKKQFFTSLKTQKRVRVEDGPYRREEFVSHPFQYFQHPLSFWFPFVFHVFVLGFTLCLGLGFKYYLVGVRKSSWFASKYALSLHLGSAAIFFFVYQVMTPTIQTKQKLPTEMHHFKSCHSPNRNIPQWSSLHKCWLKMCNSTKP